MPKTKYTFANLQDRLAVVSNPDTAETQPMEEHGPEQHLSPVRPMQPLADAACELRRGRAASNLSGGTASGSTGSNTEEDLDEEEEELQFNDDGCVVPSNEFQDNETLQILSDDECVLSPQKRAPLPPPVVDNIYGGIGVNKPNSAVAEEQVEKAPDTQKDTEQPELQPQDSQTPKDGSYEVPGSDMKQEVGAELVEESGKAIHDQVELVEDSQDDLHEAKIAEEAQEAIKSDDDTGHDNQNNSKGAFKARWW